MRYATTNNRWGRVFYEGQDAIARLDEPAAEALGYAAKLLLPENLYFKIWDAYRPKEIQAILCELEGDGRYVLNPEKSNHPKGLAVDLTLIDRHGRELDMAVDFDEFGEKSHADYDDLTEEQFKNRAKQAFVMRLADFMRYEYV